MELPIISTHSHLVYDHFYGGLTLRRLLGVTYPGWQIHFSEDEGGNMGGVFDALAGNSSFDYLCRSLGKLYGDGQPMSVENWREIDGAMRRAYQENPLFHHHILRDVCHMEWVCLDEHRNPGDDHGMEYLRPAVRVDSFMLGWNCPADKRFADYLDEMEDMVRSRPRAIALKLAVAYHRDLRFAPADWSAVRAERAAGRFGRACQNAVFERMCEIGKKYGLVVQIHTGLGCLEDTRAICLLPMLRRYSEVNFDLLHGSFPWTDDLLALGRTLDNVYVDLAWLPLLSVARSARFIREAVETFDSTRLMWGDDCWTAEESYGSVMAMEDALRMALDGHPRQALIARKILHDNAQRLFRAL